MVLDLVIRVFQGWNIGGDSERRLQLTVQLRPPRQKDMCYRSRHGLANSTACSACNKQEIILRSEHGGDFSYRPNLCGGSHNPI